MVLTLHKRVVLLLAVISLAFTTLPASAQAAVGAEVKEQLEALGIELFTIDGISYFSTGVGLETREVTYPPFSLKLILAIEGGEYLSEVAIKIAPVGGEPILEAVAKGPWFFVDLESGVYRVEATVGGVKKVLSDVKVTKGLTTTQAILWPARVVQ